MTFNIEKVKVGDYLEWHDLSMYVEKIDGALVTGDYITVDTEHLMPNRHVATSDLPTAEGLYLLQFPNSPDMAHSILYSKAVLYQLLGGHWYLLDNKWRGQSRLNVAEAVFYGNVSFTRYVEEWSNGK